MRELTRRGVRCLLSNASTEFIRGIYSEVPEFRMEEVDARRAINSDGRGRGSVKEVLVRNWT